MICLFENKTAGSGLNRKIYFKSQSDLSDVSFQNQPAIQVLIGGLLSFFSFFSSTTLRHKLYLCCPDVLVWRKMFKLLSAEMANTVLLVILYSTKSRKSYFGCALVWLGTFLHQVPFLTWCNLQEIWISSWDQTRAPLLIRQTCTPLSYAGTEYSTKDLQFI